MTAHETETLIESEIADVDLAALAALDDWAHDWAHGALDGTEAGPLAD